MKYSIACQRTLLSLLATLSLAGSVHGLILVDVTQPGDPIVPSSINSPGSEGVANAIDDSPTKYLNFDRLQTGFTVTPRVGASVVRGLSLMSANDAPERDPATYMLSGSLDGSTFTMISAGTVPSFNARFQKKTIFFENNLAYRSYRLIFPAVTGPGGNSMQIAEVELLGFAVSALQDVTQPDDPIIPTSINSPGSEGVTHAIDNLPAKYLNFDRLNTGFTVTPRTGPTVVAGISLTSANDAPERDPSEYILEGSLDGEVFSRIASGAVSFRSRFQTQSFYFPNQRAFRTYRVIFPSVAGPGGNSMQIAEVDLLGTPGSLTSFYSFDDFSDRDATQATTAEFEVETTRFYNLDHRGRPVSAVALNDEVDGTHFGTHDFIRLITPGLPKNSNRGLGLTGDFTVSAWAFPRVTGGWKILLGNTGPGGPGTLHFGLFDNHVDMGFWGNDLRGTRAVPAGRWTHLAFTYRSHGGEMSIYVDGRLDASDFGRTNTTRNENVLLGFCKAIENSHWQGFIDDFAIYCEALAPNQVAALARDQVRPDGSIPAPALASLPEVENLWSVREIYAHPNRTWNRTTAEAIASTPELGTTRDYTSAVINRYDPETNPSSSGFFGAKLPWGANNLTPKGRINGNDDQLVLVARTTLQITESGDYTFGFNSDDGARLRIVNATFSSSFSMGDTNFPNAAVPAHLGDTLSFPGQTSGSATLGVAHLVPGQYTVEFLSWEVTGESFVEVFAAKGFHPRMDSSFQLLSPSLFLPRVELTILRSGPNQVRISWDPSTGVLQQGPTPEGPWADLSATRGQTHDIRKQATFFRVIQ